MLVRISSFLDSSLTASPIISRFFPPLGEVQLDEGALLTLIQRLSGLKIGAVWDTEQEQFLGKWGSTSPEFGPKLGPESGQEPGSNPAQIYLDQGSLQLVGQGTLKNRQMVSLLLRLWQTHKSLIPAAEYWYQQYQNEQARRNQAEQDNETLLREVHHRVKNNLQVICSLLRLQSYRFTDPEIMAGFEDMQNRIQAMASLHERLYRSSSPRTISVKEYIGGLVSAIEQLYHEPIQHQKLQVELDISVAELSADMSISCGLIIHELVTNALKHAFPAESILGLPLPHQIQIQMQEVSSTIVITVCDNGVGLPENSEFATSSSIGLQLVFDLVDQLRGSISLSRNHGTRFQIRIPRL